MSLRTRSPLMYLNIMRVRIHARCTHDGGFCFVRTAALLNLLFAYFTAAGLAGNVGKRLRRASGNTESRKNERTGITENMS